MKSKLFLGLFAVLALACVSVSARADDATPFKVGMGFDLSAPSGAALGVEARLPHVPWFKLGVSGTYLLAPGVRTNVLIDPINFVIAPVANVDVGHQFTMKVPGISNSPSMDFNYLDLQGGAAIGKRDGARFLLMAGMSYLDGSVQHLDKSFTLPGGTTVGSPKFNGWVPNIKTGFELLF